MFNGDETLAEFLDGREIVISIITEIELLSFKSLTSKEETRIRQFISECTVLSISEHIKENAILYRKKYGLKLPDCIVAASSQYFDLPIITADKAFEKIKEIDLVLYETDL